MSDSSWDEISSPCDRHHRSIGWREPRHHASVCARRSAHRPDRPGHDGLEGAPRDVEERGGEAIVLRLDVADAAAVESAAAQVEDKFGAIDVWVNNPMASVFPRSMK